MDPLASAVASISLSPSNFQHPVDSGLGSTSNEAAEAAEPGDPGIPPADGRCMLLELLKELRTLIWEQAVLPFKTSTDATGYDFRESDPQGKHFEVVGHRLCFETIPEPDSDHADDGSDQDTAEGNAAEDEEPSSEGSEASQVEVGTCEHCLYRRRLALDVTKFQRSWKLLATCKQVCEEAISIYYGESEVFLPLKLVENLRDPNNSDSDSDDSNTISSLLTYKLVDRLQDIISPAMQQHVKTVAIAFTATEDFDEIDWICREILDLLPNLATCRFLVNLECFNSGGESDESTPEIFISDGLLELANKVKLVIEIVSTEDYKEYDIETYESYIGEVRGEIHGVLDPLFEAELVDSGGDNDESE